MLRETLRTRLCQRALPDWLEELRALAVLHEDAELAEISMMGQD